ncbi:hypothetical protein GFK91_31205 (plasmid) [Roseibium aggregatum]|uniref:sulfotransferase n=1 Tax=Roseibium aggregatum TaxID=187304 RepID=UPI001E389E1F|nr:sulfotransferase [Roseibium aggregatum]UES60190.1 hypothetical protein GFK91_31205 [Roseibium aggregatum]
MLPSFLCIGAQKSGTTWLYYQLREHPQIWMPPIKEIHYFDSVFIPENREWTEELIDRQCKQAISRADMLTSNCRGYEKGHIEQIMDGDKFSLQWYQSIYNTVGSENAIHRGDITPEYSALPYEGVEYVRSLLGDVRVIILIRDPVSRALSHTRMHVEHRRSTSLEELFDFVRGDVFKMMGDYKTFIPLWKSKFKENLLFVPFGRIETEPKAVIEQIEKFLCLESFCNYQLLKKKIHKTRKKQFDEEIVREIRIFCEDQYKFLYDNFPDSFLKNI